MNFVLEGFSFILETESQELTVWFSEDKLTDGESQSKHSQNNIANL